MRHWKWPEMHSNDFLYSILDATTTVNIGWTPGFSLRDSQSFMFVLSSPHHLRLISPLRQELTLAQRQHMSTLCMMETRRSTAAVACTDIVERLGQNKKGKYTAHFGSQEGNLFVYTHRVSSKKPPEKGSTCQLSIHLFTHDKLKYTEKKK